MFVRKGPAMKQALVLSFPLMEKKSPASPLPNRAREWRKATINPATGKPYTLQQAAPRIGMAFASLARIETGERELNFYWMERMAALYGCAPADFLPLQHGGLTREERAVIDLLRRLPEANRRMVDAMLESQKMFAVPPEGADVIAINRKTG